MSSPADARATQKKAQATMYKGKEEHILSSGSGLVLKAASACGGGGWFVASSSCLRPRHQLEFNVDRTLCASELQYYTDSEALELLLYIH